MSYLVLSILICFVALLAAPSWGQVREMPDPSLPEIAAVRMTPVGPVIVYNPMLCERAGPPLCGFYRKHEYGHIALNHAFRAGGQIGSPQAEAEADCWAARHATAAERQAAIQWFKNAGGSDWHYGTGLLRAERVQTCGGGAGPTVPVGTSTERQGCRAECAAEHGTCLAEARSIHSECLGGCGDGACRDECSHDATSARKDCAELQKTCEKECANP